MEERTQQVLLVARELHKKKTSEEVFFLNGGCGGTRTHDQLIKSQLRYQLRHAPMLFNCLICDAQLVYLVNGSSHYRLSSLTAPSTKLY